MIVQSLHHESDRKPKEESDAGIHGEDSCRCQDRDEQRTSAFAPSDRRGQS
jgi:hypothetical protein